MSAQRGRVEVLTIGDELLEGRLVDSNAGHISDRLHCAGLEVIRHMSVADNAGDIVAALREAAGRADAVLVSGGLGPTSDDLTAVCVAEAIGCGIERRDEAVDHLERFFAFRRRAMAPSNLKQADLPEGATILPNPRGTALGFSVVLGSSRVYCMPGVPQELKAMLENAVLPDLLERLPSRAPQIATLKVFGLGESDVAQRLEGDAPLEVTKGRLTIQYRATFPEIHIRLMLSEGDSKCLEGLLVTAGERIGDAVYAAGAGELPENLAAATVARLAEQNATVAAIDAFSGGRFGGAMLDFDREGKVFAGASLLPRPLDDVEPAAQTAREYWSTDFGVALCEGETPGTASVAVAARSGVTRRDLSFPFPRRRMRRLVAWVALELLRRRL